MGTDESQVLGAAFCPVQGVVPKGGRDVSSGSLRGVQSLRVACAEAGRGKGQSRGLHGVCLARGVGALPGSVPSLCHPETDQERTRLQLNRLLLAAAPQTGLGSLGPLQKDQPRPGWSGAWVHIGGLLSLPCPTATWDVSAICREPWTLESRPEGELACCRNRPACRPYRPCSRCPSSGWRRPLCHQV